MIDELSWGLAAARWISYLAVFIVVGAALLLSVVIPRLDRETRERLGQFGRRVVLHARLAVIVLAVTTLAKFFLQLRALVDEGDPITGELARALAMTAWGRGWWAQTAAIFLALLAWRLVGRQGVTRIGRWSTMVTALGLTTTIPLTGHAMVPDLAGPLGYPLAALHVTLGAAWLGMLGNIVIAGARVGLDRATVGRLFSGFSPIALVTGSLTVVGGGVIAWRYLGGPAGLLGNHYGTTLSIKIGFGLVILALGAYHWRIGLPKARRDLESSLRPTVTAEVIGAFLLLGATAVLTGLATPLE